MVDAYKQRFFSAARMLRSKIIFSLEVRNPQMIPAEGGKSSLWTFTFLEFPVCWEIEYFIKVFSGCERLTTSENIPMYESLEIRKKHFPM